MARHYFSFVSEFCQMEAHFIKRDACSYGDLFVEPLAMCFQVLQYFFHSFLITDMAEAVNVR